MSKGGERTISGRPFLRRQMFAALPYKSESQEQHTVFALRRIFILRNRVTVMKIRLTGQSPILEKTFSVPTAFWMSFLFPHYIVGFFFFFKLFVYF